MSDAIAERVQGFDLGKRVTLYEIDATAFGAGVSYFTDAAKSNADLVFGTNTYKAVPTIARGFEWNGKGPLPRPTLRISNVTLDALALVLAFDDLVGATIRRIRTYEDHLDGGSDPDTGATHPIDTYVVARKAAQNSEFIEWELSAAIDQQGRTLPGRTILRNACTHSYRVWDPDTEAFDYTNATCPYVGTASFDASDVAATGDEDDCGRRLSSCKARFGETGILPTRAFPGVARVR